jgi:nicotinate dehydrogenase subunit A
MSGALQFILNGQAVSVQTDPMLSLLDYLRDNAGLMATRQGCGLGQCGACKVLIDDAALPACDTPMWAVAGKAVTTLEGLGTREAPHRLQTAFIEEQALQCGYCTSGMIMAGAALLRRLPQPTEADIKAALEGNLCRCGVHNRVVCAITKAAS